MTNLNIKASSDNEKIILNYLQLNASESLADRINAGDKTLTQCWNYIISEAKKASKNGVACVLDSVVFGWAVHFFEEDSIKGTEFNKSNGAVKTAKTVTVASLSCEDHQPDQKAEGIPKKSPPKPTPLDQIGFDFGDF
jgi:hypothetical protein